MPAHLNIYAIALLPPLLAADVHDPGSAARALSAWLGFQPMTSAQAPDASFRALDLNGDEGLTREEFRRDRLPEGVFRTLDTDRDGIVSAAELGIYERFSEPVRK